MAVPMTALRLLTILAALAVLGGRQPAAASDREENLCLTCPQPEPACWMALYRWQDYNLNGGFGTTVVVTTGQPPGEDDKARATADLQRGLPATTTVVITKSSRIACPPGTRVGN